MKRADFETQAAALPPSSKAPPSPPSTWTSCFIARRRTTPAWSRLSERLNASYKDPVGAAHCSGLPEARQLPDMSPENRSRSSRRFESGRERSHLWTLLDRTIDMSGWPAAQGAQSGDGHRVQGDLRPRQGSCSGAADLVTHSGAEARHGRLIGASKLCWMTEERLRVPFSTRGARPPDC